MRSFCSNCSKKDFPDYEKLSRHEINCESSLSSENNRTNTSSKFPLNSETNDGPTPKTPHNLEPRIKQLSFVSSTEKCPEKVSPIDFIACQNIEVFKASTCDVADYEDSVIVNIGQIGFRCIHCARNPFVKAAHNTIFPCSLGSLATTLQLITKHFSICSNLDCATKLKLEKTFETFHCNEFDVEWYSEGLAEYALDLCRKLDIVNRYPAQTGLIFGYENKSMKDVSENSNKKTTTDYRYYTPGRYRYYAPVLDENCMEKATETGGAMSTTEKISQKLQCVPSSDPNFPFIQNQHGFWECRFCNSSSMKYSGFSWQSTQPPNRHFVESHLNLCQNQSDDQYKMCSNRAESNMSYQSNSCVLNNTNQYWKTPTIRTKPKLLVQSQPVYLYPPSMVCPSNLHPFSVPSHFQTGGTMMKTLGHSHPDMELREELKSEYSIQNLNEASDSSFNAAIEFLENEEDKKIYPHEYEIEVNRRLVLDEDKVLLTDYFYYIMKQLRHCEMTESDRKSRGGKRESIDIGFSGLQCVHCANIKTGRKFYWSTVDRIANSFAEIPRHVLTCKQCPTPTKQALQTLKQRHHVQMKKLPRGSQKIFFRRLWRRLHNQATKEKKYITTEDAPNNLVESASVEKLDTRLILAINEDKDWLSDMECFLRCNFELFAATEYDVICAEADKTQVIYEGQIGMRCIHCAISKEGARNTAVVYPPKLNTICEYVNKFCKGHLLSCPCIPNHSKKKLASLNGSSTLGPVQRRYYVQAAKTLGLYDTDKGLRIVVKHKSLFTENRDDMMSSSTTTWNNVGFNHDELLESLSYEEISGKRKFDDTKNVIL